MTEIQAVRSVHLLAALIGAVLASLPAPREAHAETTLRIAMTLSDIPQTTGQANQGAEGARFVGLNLYEGLVRWDLSKKDEAAKIIPGLAVSWTIDPETHTRWTFKLRKNVAFHDGSAFNAASVVWNLDKIANKASPQYDPAQAAQASGYIVSLKSYARIDDETVELVTKQPDSVFIYRVAQILMSSPARFEQVGRDWTKFALTPSGTGPWMLDKLTPRERAEMVRNPNYHTPERAPKTDRLVLLAMPDSTTRVAALLSGQIDWAEAPAPDTVPRLRQAGMQIVTNVYPHIWPFWLSFAEGSPFRDIRIRKAANLAIDRDGLVQFLGGLAAPARGQLIPTSPWFGKPTFDVKYDPDAARKLMAEAGYGPNKRLKIKLLTSPAGSGQMQPLPMTEFVQENLREVGFDIDVEVVDWESLRGRRRAGAEAPENKGLYGLNSSWTTVEPDMGLLSTVGSTMRPPGGNNWGGYKDETTDALIAQIRDEFDPPKQDALLAQLHAHMVDQATWLWVVHDLNPRALSPKVKGFVPPQSWYADFTTVTVE